MYYHPQFKKSFFNDPVMHYFIIDTTKKEDRLKMAYRLAFHEDMERLDNLLMQLNAVTAGTEFLETNVSFKSWLRDVGIILSRVGNRIFKLGRSVVESVFKKYELAARLWNDRIMKNIDRIDDIHFHEKIVSTIPLQTFKERTEVVGVLINIINNAQSIVNEKIADPDNEEQGYITPQFVQGYKQLKEIGFELTNKTFTESRSQGYSAKEEKRKLGDHGYSKSDLPELVNIAKEIAAKASKKWLEKTVKDFHDLNNALFAHEKEVMISKTISDSEKQLELKKVKIKINRVWWLSNFIHVLHQLCGDQMEYILRIFRAADDSIPHAENKETGNKYFND